MLVIELPGSLDQVAFAAQVLGVLVRIWPAVGEGHLVVHNGGNGYAPDLQAMLAKAIGAREAAAALLLSSTPAQTLSALARLSLLRWRSAGQRWLC